MAAILKGTGNSVYTNAPERMVGETIAELADSRIGAPVVLVNGVDVTGIVFERDIIRALAELGPALLERPVESLMTRDVLISSSEDTGRDILNYMTERRVRHFPVMENDNLSGMASIGDVVKSRLNEIMHEADSPREDILHS